MSSLAKFLAAADAAISKHTTLNETTVPDHLMHRVDDLESYHLDYVSDATREKMSKAMTHGMHTHFPLAGVGSDSDPDVIEHLVNHGYEIKDYQKGIVSKKKIVGDGVKFPKTEKSVDYSIGSVLDKTNASDTVKKSYMNDPARSASKSKDSLHVVISHSPLAIAGMSTGTGWSSCMNMDPAKRGTVNNSHYLNADVEHGTHAAYLVRGDDKMGLEHGHPERPIARIALKPFHEDHGDHHNGDTIFRAEHQQYGSGGTAFDHAVRKWSETNYPAQKDVTYYKNGALYDDDGRTEYEEMSGSSIEDALLTHGNGSMPKTALPHEVDHMIKFVGQQYHADKEKHTALLGGSEFAGEQAAKVNLGNRLAKIGNINNLTTQHVSILHRLNKEHGFAEEGNDNNWSLAVAHGGKFSTNMINEHAERYPDNIPRNILANRKLPQHVADGVGLSSIVNLHPSKITPAHIDKVVDNYVAGGSGSYYNINDLKQHLNSDHISKLVEHYGQSGGNSDVALGLINHPKFTREHFDGMMGHVAANHSKYKYTPLRTIMSSKHATADDAIRMSKLDTDAVNSFMEREHPMSSDDATKIKNHLVDGESRGSISKAVGDKFTKEDYSKAALNPKFLSDFDIPDHSNKMISAHFDHANKIDDKITVHLEHKNDEDPDYDEDDDSEVSKMKDEMHHHLGKMATRMDSHIDRHVEDDDERGYLKSEDQKYEILDHFDKIDGLENYKTENNSDRWDQKDHWDDHFADVHTRIHEMNDYYDPDHNW